MLDLLKKRFKEMAPRVDYCSLRFRRERQHQLRVRQDVVQPLGVSEDAGVMITIHHGGGMGYAATCDLSTAGLKRAARKALDWAQRSAAKAVLDFRSVTFEKTDGAYESPVEKPWDTVPLKEKIDLLMRESKRLKVDDKIVDWSVCLENRDIETLLLNLDGGVVRQRFHILIPELEATANEGAETATRSFGGFRLGRQGGLEILDRSGFMEAAPRVASEALEVLAAPDCPSGKMDLLLAPDQMILQIHESIGHPLELDRILGDERNYAGASFVTLEMFGAYRYGSDLLNITFDPTIQNQFASYGYDDEGRKATREYIIRKGILERPLGATISQARTGLGGVANARAQNWNRPPIDRMANLNLEPGASSFDELVRSVERGVYMASNNSWSIDDSRNKFQFGCEYGRVIENGELKHVIKKPNYRGISATFWRNLKKVGNRDTFEVLGTPNCGKGEPNQVVYVGHAAPAALFADVDVFGGEG